ncbi:peptidylprolyl isomerase [Sediminitomix flava]|uniref:peptidylprolyl isomerase n=1 Tax=Sediminitomix flava TaxID=379075 RepID=A0A315Z735_SEDFL|nr:peptidylprolyl isomerase [Sediminitomix flava]PWJ39964.1 cyclophilin family peptidyl-prolyl cis-trans isomerase [Sediminitomix flava]
MKRNNKIFVFTVFALALGAFLFFNNFFSTQSIFLNKYENKKLQNVLKLQLARDTEALEKLYQKSKSAEIKASIISALGKIQDPKSEFFLMEVLKDTLSDLESRKEAAFAIGQFRNNKNAADLTNLITSESEKSFVDEMIVALGKVGGEAQLDFLVHLKESNHQYAFSCLQGLSELLAKGIYNEQAVFNILEKFLSEDEMYRTLGAQYFSRVPNLDAVIPYASITGLINNETDTDSRSKLILSLRHYPKNGDVKKFLLNHLETEKSPLVLMEALQALNSFSLTYREKKKVIPSLSSENKGVSYYASKLIADKMIAWEVEYWEKVIDRISYSKAKSILLASMVKNSNKKSVLAKVKSLYSSSSKTHERAWYLDALCKDTTQWELATKVIMQDTSQQLKTSALQSLINAYKQSDEQVVKAVYPKIEEEFLAMLKVMLESNDEGLISIAASSLRDPVLGYKRLIEDYEFLYTTKDKLRLPLQYEALYELNKTIAYYEGKDEENLDPSVFLKKELNTKTLATIPSDGIVKVETSEGNIFLRLNLEKSPIGVQHFVENLHKGYYNHKRFHRVVHDFVVQTGCHRGDGFGTDAEELIPSEFTSDYYEKGTVGVASLGKDTESSQWFITLTDTPRLNGRYTVIGKVIQGMDVVERLSEEDYVLNVSWENNHLLI